MNNLVYVCSPYRGNIRRNKEYARELTKIALDNGFLPVTVHLFEMKNMSTIINDGHVIGFIGEEYKVIVKKRG